VPLQKVRTFGRNGYEWHNHLIFGDNLQVMKSLLVEKKAGRLRNADGSDGVRLVYIDPPFATKRDFSGSQEQKAYQDKIGGARFIEFIRQRLVLIRELLASDGSLFFHTDQRKGHYLKIVLDEVFGEHNFRNEIILPGRASKNIQQQFSENITAEREA
jgi:adenine specific DNA methylase Mod